MVAGLLISSKLARLWPGGPAAVDVHRFMSLLALAAALVHALVLFGDRYIGYTPHEVLVPFASGRYQRLWVGLGQVGLYLAVVVACSFFLRRRLGYRTWRLLHYGSFAVYLLTTAHGLGAGTDTTTMPMLVLYSLSGLSTYFLTIYRLLVSARQPQHMVRGST
jgi:predicted ferric reductase